MTPVPIRCALLVGLALLAGACAGESDGNGPEAATAARQAGSLSDALAAARSVDLPEEVIRPDFGDIEAIHGLTGSAGFVETYHARGQQASGDFYEVDLRVVHQAEPSAYHATLSLTGEGPQFELRRQVAAALEDTGVDVSGTSLLGGGLGPYEVIRIGTDYWTREGESTWTGPTSTTEVVAVAPPTPIARLSRTFDSDSIVRTRPDPVGEEPIAGRATSHVRFEGNGSFGLFWSAVSFPALPILGAYRPPGGLDDGSVDVWATSSGLVLKAILHMELPAGGTYSARFDVTEFGVPPTITPPR